MVDWFIHLTLIPRFDGSNPSPALTSFGKTIIQMCHSPPGVNVGVIIIAGPSGKQR